MAEYISREDVLEILHKVRYECVYNRQNVMYDGKVDAYKALVARVKAMPTADVVERKKGKWEVVVSDDNEFLIHACSVCGHGYHMPFDFKGNIYFHNFCPNCGSYNGGDDNVDE